MDYESCYIIIIILLCIAIAILYIWKERTIQENKNMYQHEIDSLRANFAIYVNASEMQIAFLKDMLKQYDENYDKGKGGIDFSVETRTKIEKDLQKSIINYED